MSQETDDSAEDADNPGLRAESPEKDEMEREIGSNTNELTQSQLHIRIRTSRRKPTDPQRANVTRSPRTGEANLGQLETPSASVTDLSVLQASGNARREGECKTANDPPGGEVGSQHHNAVDEAYAETRHLLGPLLDVLGEGEIVQNRDSGLVDRSQSGGDKAGDLS